MYERARRKMQLLRLSHPARLVHPAGPAAGSSSPMRGCGKGSARMLIFFLYRCMGMAWKLSEGLRLAARLPNSSPSYSPFLLCSLAMDHGSKTPQGT